MTKIRLFWGLQIDHDIVNFEGIVPLTSRSQLGLDLKTFGLNNAHKCLAKVKIYFTGAKSNLSLGKVDWSGSKVGGWISCD